MWHITRTSLAFLFCLSIFPAHEMSSRPGFRDQNAKAVPNLVGLSISARRVLLSDNIIDDVCVWLNVGMVIAVIHTEFPIVGKNYTRYGMKQMNHFPGRIAFQIHILFSSHPPGELFNLVANFWWCWFFILSNTIVRGAVCCSRMTWRKQIFACGFIVTETTNWIEWFAIFAIVGTDTISDEMNAKHLVWLECIWMLLYRWFQWNRSVSLLSIKHNYAGCATFPGISVP